jgi:hypothetical protein
LAGELGADRLGGGTGRQRAGLGTIHLQIVRRHGNFAYAGWIFCHNAAMFSGNGLRLRFSFAARFKRTKLKHKDWRGSNPGCGQKADTERNPQKSGEGSGNHATVHHPWFAIIIVQGLG